MTVAARVGAWSRSQRHKDTPLDDKLERLGRLLAGRARRYGATKRFEEWDRLLVDEPLYDSFRSLLYDLEQDGLINVNYTPHSEYPSEVGKVARTFSLTVKGWKNFSNGSPVEQPVAPVVAPDKDRPGTVAVRSPAPGMRLAIIQTNPGSSAVRLCVLFDSMHLPIDKKWSAEFEVKSWQEAYRIPHLRARIDSMISKDKKKID